MKRPMHHHAVALSALLHIAPGLAHAQQHEADAYHWLNDFVLADVNGDTLLDIAATNHAVRTRIRLNQGRLHIRHTRQRIPILLPPRLPGAHTRRRHPGHVRAGPLHLL